MRKRSMVFVVFLSVFALNLGVASTENNDNKATLEEQEEASLIASIEYIEDETNNEFDLGFNVYAYLPLDFDPYKGMIYSLEDIEYIEPHDELDL